MAKKEEDIVELTKILKRIRANARRVAWDFTLAVRAIFNLGISYLSMGVLGGVFTVAFVFRGDWMVVLISVALAIIGLLLGGWTMRFYHRMRKKYAILFKLTEE